MTEPRFLLGHGERLTAPVAPPGGGGIGEEPYSLTEAIDRLAPMLDHTVQLLDSLPTLACPENDTVIDITLHPQWIAKSYHPQQLLQQWHLRQVGSRPVVVQPEKWTRKSEPDPVPSMRLFVAGKRSDIHAWASAMDKSSPLIDSRIRKIEQIQAPVPTERLRHGTTTANPDLLEVVLHASANESDGFIVRGFEAYAAQLGYQAVLDRRRYVGGLCFIPVWDQGDDLIALARYSFLRVARPMPSLRSPIEIPRSMMISGASPSPLPDADPIDKSLHVAVLDGGLTSGSQLSRWANNIDIPGISTGVGDFLAHGHDVTSAVLFGSIHPGVQSPTPYSYVDHYRVLDQETGKTDPFELYDVLDRVEAVIASGFYELINLSVGPDLPIEDDEVHLWTALLDTYLADGKTLITVAAGNNGASTDPCEARIQVPGDIVNGLTVGAATLSSHGLVRAPYSAIGPGRSPGRTKPDFLHFGGDSLSPFMVYEQGSGLRVAGQVGTSFAAPSVLRLAAGVRAHMGKSVDPLALRALLVHNCVMPKGADRSQVGWGLLESSPLDLVTCTDGEVRVLFQGELIPGKYLRAPVPMPRESLTGNVTIKATFCYASPTNPENPDTYTRCGLDITFRPDETHFQKEEATVPISATFFRKTDFDNEASLRQDAQKWETVLSAEKTMRGSSLNHPVFDIHYNARSGGGKPDDARPISYALVLTVSSKRTPDLYDQVVRAYPGVLVPLTPVISIPIRL